MHLQVLTNWPYRAEISLWCWSPSWAPGEHNMLLWFAFFKHLVHTIVSLEAFLERKHCYGPNLITTSGKESNKQLAEVNGKIWFELCGLSAGEVNRKGI